MGQAKESGCCVLRDATPAPLQPANSYRDTDVARVGVTDDADLRPALLDAEKRIAALQAQLNNEVLGRHRGAVLPATKRRPGNGKENELPGASRPQQLAEESKSQDDP